MVIANLIRLQTMYMTFLLNKNVNIPTERIFIVSRSIVKCIHLSYMKKNHFYGQALFHFHSQNCYTIRKKYIMDFNL